MKKKLKKIKKVEKLNAKQLDLKSFSYYNKQANQEEVLKKSVFPRQLNGLRGQKLAVLNKQKNEKIYTKQGVTYYENLYGEGRIG